MACDPVLTHASAACGTDKCNWTSVGGSPPSLECVPAGTTQEGGSCNSNFGFDTCAAGLTCMNNTCQQVCDTTDRSSCFGRTHCVDLGSQYNAGGTTYGLCTPECDPLAQTGCGANQGCYLLSSSADTVAVCAGPGSVGAGETITGQVYANSCRPGLVPRRAEGGTTTVCAPLCNPAPVYQGLNDGQPGRPDYSGGDPSVTNWLGQPATCEGGGAPGEQCLYYRMRELTDGVTAFSNTLGTCWDTAARTYDSSGMGTGPNLPWPLCKDVTLDDVLPPTGGDAQFFFCIPLPIR